MSNVSWVKTDNSITINYNGETHTVLQSSPEYEEVLLCLKEGRKEDIPGVISRATAIKDYSQGSFQVKGGCLMVDGRVVPTRLADKILEFKNEGLPFEPLVAFAKNLLKNPSYHAVQMLFGFLEKNRHPITEDGCFIAYKAVGEDFMDKHSKTFDNSPGKVCQMPRNEVDEDPTATCSRGLHVASWEYAKNIYGGEKMVEVKINPEHVVAVPVDYDQAKMRTCEYLVLNEVQNARKSSVVMNDGNDYVRPDSRASDDVSGMASFPIRHEDDEEQDEECENCGSFDHETYDCEEEDYSPQLSGG